MTEEEMEILRQMQEDKEREAEEKRAAKKSAKKGSPLKQ